MSAACLQPKSEPKEQNALQIEYMAKKNFEVPPTNASTSIARLQFFILGAAAFVCGIAAHKEFGDSSSIESIKKAPELSSIVELGNLEQHIWIVRHGDKASSYPDCSQISHVQPCYNKTLMGDNPPLTECGRKQAKHVAEWLAKQASTHGGIQHLLVSPFTRTLQTALPLAERLDLKLKVEYSISESNQADGPFQPFNAGYDGATAIDLKLVSGHWDLDYGSPPIFTPETPGDMYPSRIKKARDVIKKRIPTSAGNLVIFTHATPVLSLAFGLCGDGDDEKLKDFIDRQKPVPPAGVVHLVLDANGNCKGDPSLAQNIGNEKEKCGKTDPFKCDYEDFPAWYWHSAAGKGPGNCP